MSGRRPLPLAYFDAVVTISRARGRDFEARPLTVGEQHELLTSFLIGRTAEQAAQVIAGELICLRPWETPA